MNWEEACNYIWRTNTDDEFILRIVNGGVEYQYIGKEAWNSWCAANDQTVYYMDYFKKIGEVEPFCGPMQPPPSPVVLKIRQMYARREYV